MSRTVTYDQAVVTEAAKSSYGTIPAGSYVVEIQAVERKKASNDVTSLNNKLEVLNIQFKIVGGASNGRMLFSRVPDFPRWSPSVKSPAGAVAQDHFKFFEAVGVKFVDEAGHVLPAVTFPDDRELNGKKVGVRVKISPANAYNAEPFNEVGQFMLASKVPPAAGAPAVAVARSLAPVAAPVAHVTVTPTADNPFGVTSDDIAFATLASTPMLVGASI